MLSTRCCRTVASCDTYRWYKQRSLLTAGDDDEMFMTISLIVTRNTAEQHLMACSDKSVACVTNNGRLCSTFCTIEANYRVLTDSTHRMASLRQQSFLFQESAKKSSRHVGAVVSLLTLQLSEILSAIQTGQCRKNFQSTSVEFEALCAISRYRSLLCCLRPGCLQLWTTWKSQGICSFWKTQGI